MKNILIVFFLFIQFVVVSKPLAPTINYLSVDSATSQVEIYWTNNSFDVIGYIVYHYDLNGIWVSLDTVNGINRAQLEIGSIEVKKHEMMHNIASFRDQLTLLQTEFEKEYGTFDIDIQTGTINYTEENGEVNKKD